MNKLTPWLLMAGLGVSSMTPLAQACSALAGTEPTPLLERVTLADQVFSGEVVEIQDGVAVIAVDTYFKGTGEDSTSIVDLYTNSCSTFPEVGETQVFFAMTDLEGQLLGQYDSIYGATVPADEATLQLLSQSAAVDTQLQALDLACTASFDGETLHIPCLKLVGSEEAFMADLTLNPMQAENAASNATIKFSVQSLTPLTEVYGDPMSEDGSELSEVPSDVLVFEPTIETVQVMQTESVPPQAFIEVSGYLNDGCGELRSLTLELQQDNTFMFSLQAERPNDPELSCTQALVPFTVGQRLDMTDLDSGTYTVQVNEMSETFTWESVIVDPVTSEPLIQDAVVEELTLLQAESFPPQIFMVVSGYLRNGCEALMPLSLAGQADNTFSYQLQTTQPTGPTFVACTEALVPYEIREKVNTTDLEDGTYTVDVNGVTASFEWDIVQ